MALKVGQEVRIINARHVIGKIVRLRDPQSDIYEVELDPRHLYLRESSLEVLDDQQSKGKKLQPKTGAWYQEIIDLPRLLQDSLADPNDAKLLAAAMESLERLGIIVPAARAPGA